MKKKLIAATALALSTVTLAACGATNEKLTLSPNWEIGIISEATTATAEELTYSVTFKESSFLQKDYYTVEYCGKENAAPGVYTTKLEYLSDNTYRYTTSLTMQVTFTLADGQTETKTDSVQTTAIFKKADKSLQPISSKKTVLCYSPNNVAATALDKAYTEYHYEFSIEYADDLSGGTLTKTDLSEARTLLEKENYPDGKDYKSFSIDNKKYTYLDNEQLLCALRAIPNSSIASSKTVNVYNASLMTVETVTTTPSTAAKTKFNFALNGEASSEHEIEYTPLTIKTGNKDSLLSHTLWYAKTTDANNNKYRNVLLKMSVPLHFGMGTLTYELTAATFSAE